MKIAVTGGAGFIGSHLCEKLVEKHEVTAVDNFSSGLRENLPEKVEIVEHDIKEKGLEEIFQDKDVVFHLAANPKVNTFPDDRDKDFDENLEGTHNVLDAAETSNVEEIIFTSSSVVYGEDAEIPTPEDANLDPISMYGATKAGGEHMCSVYSEIFDIDLTIVRLANIVGGRNQKGVIYDFIHKLKDNPEKLVILGNGKQRKSYLHVEDTVEGFIKAWESDKTVFNIGSEDSIDVDGIAEIVAEEMDLEPEYEYTGGEKGWEGDVPEMRLSIEKLKNEGWRPEHNSSSSVRKTVQELLDR
ncbi:NAD-dependent epimerase/dehydratase family protein [Candidatus Nanosalina sp. VS9-1]|uniref:NAD-dependent epimerase/dehydratase family protein n=1 Tax=Candidatus Nanosalina sp. VS9-1 TaxID=3388566 RepID=UPI0039E08537